jgi:hypothetical protein
MPRRLTILDVESLFVYIAHLFILCGWVTNVESNLLGGGEAGLLLLNRFSFLWV